MLRLVDNAAGAQKSSGSCALAHHRRSSGVHRRGVGHKRQSGPATLRVWHGTRYRRGLSRTVVVAGQALHRYAGKNRPLITHLQDLAHLVEKFSLGVVAPPRSAKDRRSAAPDARRVQAIGARYCRTDFFAVPTLQEPKAPLNRRFLDNQRASTIRPTKNEFGCTNGIRRLLVMWITNAN
jgi:hypothetical protein